MKIMKTKLLKNFAILSIALMGLFLIGNNVIANSGVDDFDYAAGSWVNCRHNNGAGIPFFGRVCGECRVVLKSTFGTEGKCYK
jgi:hypothetical protein